MEVSLLEEAWKALKEAEQEYRTYLETEESMKLRNACEKGWLSVVLATDYLLTLAGAEKPRGRIERNELLEELERHAPELERLGLTDRMWARATRLHSEGYYEGWISKESLRVELGEVKRYLRDVGKLAEAISRRRGKLEPLLREVQKKWKR